MRSVILSLLAAVFACHACSAPPDYSSKAVEEYGKLPLHFEPNRGQVDPQVRFLMRLPEMTIYLTDNETVLSWHRQKQQAVVRMKLTGAVTPKRVEGTGQLPGIQNYFRGADPSKWTTNIPLYEKVHYKGIYPGVDAVFYGNRQKLEWDFVVAPNTDPDQIAMDFSGAKSIKLAESGDLLIQTDLGSVQLDKPVIYQHSAGKRQKVKGAYALTSANRVKFQLGAYDRSLPLVIDPTLAYSTLFGGIDSISVAKAVTVDAEGYAFIAGVTSDSDFPVVNAVQDDLAGSWDAFVTKLNPSGTALVYSTYLGGTSTDGAGSIAVDSAGNAYIAGSTESQNFPIRSAAQISNGGAEDAFIAKLSPAGNSLVYSTYLGGANYEAANLAINRQTGEAYIVGTTNSLDFPIQSPFQDSLAGCSDAFVAKFTAVGVKQFATYLGGTGCDSGRAIAVDGSDNIYLTGTTDGNFPVLPGAFQTAYGGGYRDLFVSAMNPQGSILKYSTYLGGSGSDSVEGIAVHSSGTAFITGGTDSRDFPVTPGVVQPAPPPDPNGFVTRLNANGSGLLYSTYLGGRRSDTVSAIAVEEPTGNVVLTGSTDSDDFPVANAIQTRSRVAAAVIFRTPNGGLNWAPADTGVSYKPGNRLSIDPLDPNSVLTTGFRTTDGGNSWTPMIGPDSAEVIVHASSATVYAADSKKIYKSLNGGASWSVVSGYFEGQGVSDLAVHPTNTNVLYAAASTGVFYSSDGGATWKNRNTGLGYGKPYSIRIARANPNVIYGAVRSGMLYKSLNGGMNWQQSNLDSVNHFSLHPADPNTAYAVRFGCVWKTTDGGAHWTSLDRCEVTSVEVSQSNPSVIYAVGTRVYRSGDAGATWSAMIGGIEGAKLFAFAVAPSNDKVAYVGTKSFSSGFVTRLTPAGKAYLYSTFLGGSSGHSVPYGVAVNGTGVYITGMTNSSDFPTTTGAIQRNLTIAAAFIAKISNATAACSNQAYPVTKFFYPAGGEQLISIVAPSGCQSMASADAPWIHIAAPTVAEGIRSLFVSVDQNTGPARASNLRVGDKAIPIRQAASGCTYMVESLSLAVPSAGGNFKTTITTDPGCEWQVEGDIYNWLTISPDTFTGTGSANISIHANRLSSMRYASLRIANSTFTIMQEANGTPPAAPSKPTPANGALNVALTTSLKWQAASGASSYDVYFGPTNPPALLGSTVAPTYQLPSLATGTTYYWYAVSRNNAGQTSSPTWSFKTVAAPAAPAKPAPANGAANVSRTPTLQWQIADGATSYDVYCGTTANPPKLGNTTDTSYSPGTLQAKKKYYWRVIAKSATGTKTSPTWSFTTR